MLQSKLTRRPFLGLALWATLAFPSAPAAAATLTVGPGKMFATVTAAVNASQGGDTIDVSPGTYTNDFPTVARGPLTIRGVGPGLSRLLATVPPPNGKGILLVRATTTVFWMEFEGAAVPSRNGAGIRWEAGDLFVRRSYFHDNENGVLGNNGVAGRIEVYRSEFARNGNGEGLTHGVYLGDATPSVLIQNSYFHDTRGGHHVKSRALRTTVRTSRLVDGTGASSYSVDTPNGGVVLIEDNRIEQAADAGNGTLLNFGGEAGPYPDSSLLVQRNLLQNFRSTAIGVRNVTGVTARITGNRLHRLPVVAAGPNLQSGNTVLASPEAIPTNPPWR